MSSTTPVSVSSLIANLQNDRSDSFKSLIDSLILCKEKACADLVLVIDIDSDDDFTINDKSTFTGEFIIENNDVIATFHKAIASLNFSTHCTKDYVLTRFITDLKEDWVARHLLAGHVSFGGNQTLEAYIQKPTTTLSIGNTVIDLKS